MSQAISQQAAAVINSIAADANHHRWLTVQVSGPSAAKKKGNNPGLAGPRLLAVERALSAAGVDERRIVVMPSGPQPKPDASGAQRFEIRLIEKPVS